MLSATTSGTAIAGAVEGEAPMAFAIGAAGDVEAWAPMAFGSVGTGAVDAEVALIVGGVDGVGAPVFGGAIPLD